MEQWKLSFGSPGMDNGSQIERECVEMADVEVLVDAHIGKLVPELLLLVFRRKGTYFCSYMICPSLQLSTCNGSPHFEKKKLSPSLSAEARHCLPFDGDLIIFQ